MIKGLLLGNCCLCCSQIQVVQCRRHCREGGGDLSQVKRICQSRTSTATENLSLAIVVTAILVEASLEESSEAKEASFGGVAQALQLQTGLPKVMSHFLLTHPPTMRYTGFLLRHIHVQRYLGQEGANISHTLCLKPAFPFHNQSSATGFNPNHPI